MDEETFPFDHLIMLKYRYNPIVKLGAIVGKRLKRWLQRCRANFAAWTAFLLFRMQF